MSCEWDFMSAEQDNCKRWTSVGMVATAARSVRWTTPKGTALRMISWYQANVSAGRDLCSRPAPYNCSNRAAWMIRSYGLIIGGMMTFWVTVLADCGSSTPPENSHTDCSFCDCA